MAVVWEDRWSHCVDSYEADTDEDLVPLYNRVYPAFLHAGHVKIQVDKLRHDVAHWVGLCARGLNRHGLWSTLFCGFGPLRFL